MAGEPGGDPRPWLAVDETAAAFLSRSLSTRPPILLPPPLHRAPLRPGNVVEIAGPSNSGKSQLLLTAAVQCILPKEWKGTYFGGLGKAVMYLDLDCRFDVLRLAQVLRNRIAECCGSTYPTNEELEKDGATNSSLEKMLFSDCMKRFLYARCYNSSDFIAALQNIHSQSQAKCEVLGVGIYFLMIDSIGSFYWMDRDSQPIVESKGRTLSLQSMTETVVHKLRNFLQLQPVLVMVTKAPIYGEGFTTGNDFQRGTSNQMSEDSTVRCTGQEEEKNISYREFMPSVWQSIVTHRIKLQDLGQEAEFLSGQENKELPLHTSEWMQPSLNTKDKFSITDILPFLRPGRCYSYPLKVIRVPTDVTYPTSWLDYCDLCGKNPIGDANTLISSTGSEPLDFPWWHECLVVLCSNPCTNHELDKAWLREAKV